MFRGFDDLFGKKLQKVAHFVKTHRFGQNLHVFEQAIMFRSFDELMGKKFQKLNDFVKTHEKSSIWQKLASFPANYHVLRF